MFSVIIPVHNKLPHLERSIHSVLNQTFQDFQLILVDDASSDGSSEKLRTFKDPRIRVLTRDVPGPGGYAARNLGISAAKNRWICFLDADDEWKPDYLQNVAGAIRSNPGIKLFASGYFVSDVTFSRNGMYYQRNSKRGSHQFDFTAFLLQKPVWTGAVVIEKDTLIKAGLFPEGRARAEMRISG
jgi:glycosyltransferase involved in cell wall biosynthesis